MTSSIITEDGTCIIVRDGHVISAPSRELAEAELRRLKSQRPKPEFWSPWKVSRAGRAVA